MAGQDTGDHQPSGIGDADRGLSVVAPFADRVATSDRATLDRTTDHSRSLDRLIERIRLILDALVDWDQTLPFLAAELIAAELEPAALSRKELLQVLNSLKASGHFDRFFIVLGTSRFSRLRRVLGRAGLDWEYFVNNFRLNPAHVASFFAGFAVGVGQFYFEALYLFWMLSGSLIDEGFARERGAFVSGLVQFFKHPIVAATKGLVELEASLSDHLVFLEFFEAGRIVGQIVITLLTLGASLEKEARRASKLVRRVVQVGRAVRGASLAEVAALALQSAAEAAGVVKATAQEFLASIQALARDAANAVGDLRKVLGANLDRFAAFLADPLQLAYESPNVGAIKLGRDQLVILCEGSEAGAGGPFTISGLADDLEELIKGKKVSDRPSGARKRGSRFVTEAEYHMEAGAALERLTLEDWARRLGRSFRLILNEGFEEDELTRDWASKLFRPDVTPRTVLGPGERQVILPGPDALAINVRKKLLYVGDATSIARAEHFQATVNSAERILEFSQTADFPDELRGFGVYAEDVLYGEKADRPVRRFVGTTAKGPR